MSRKIDLSKPLSDFDREYLELRGRWADIADADAATDSGQEAPADPSEGSGGDKVPAAPQKTSEDFETDAEWVESLTVSQLVTEIQSYDKDFVQGKLKKEELQAELLGLLEADND